MFDFGSFIQIVWRFWEIACETITAFSLLTIAIKYKNKTK